MGRSGNLGLGFGNGVFWGRCRSPRKPSATSSSLRLATRSETIMLPIFGRDDRSYLGVAEVMSTVQKINYGSDLDNVNCPVL